MMLTQRHSFNGDYLSFISKAVRLGVNCIQFREKHITKESIDFALDLKKLLQPYNVPLIINDNLNLAKEVNADGVHLGQNDTDVSVARKILGDKKIIGLSLEDYPQIDTANQLNVDYVACSAVFPTKSKNNIKKIWGLNGLADMCKKSIHPVIAIGGIDENNADSIIANGAAGVAVISALHDSQNLDAAIAKFNQALEKTSWKK